MSDAKKPVPFFAQIGVSLMLTREDGTLHPVFFTVGKLGPEGIEGVIESLLEQFAEQGFFPVSREQYASFAEQLLRDQQEKFVYGQLQDRATAPEELRKFLATYEGRPGGDA